MTTSLKSPSPTPWAGMVSGMARGPRDPHIRIPSLGLMQQLYPWQERPQALTWRRTVGTGSFMPTTTRRCSALPPFASLWWAMRCWHRHSGTSPQSR